MIDRSKIPEIKSVETLKLHTPIRYRLANDIPVYEINLGNQSVIKLELIFHAGRWHEKEQLIAKATAQLLKTGTLNKNSEQIADFFEYYGAILAIYDGFNTVNIQLQCLSKHLKTLLPMLKEILCEPAFSEIELTKFIKLNQQNLKVQLTKNDIVAYRLFTEKIFGHNHPYGYNSTIASYTNITRDKIITHFKENYTANNCTIIISGKIPENAINLLNAHFGELPIKPKQNVFNPQMPKLEANLSLKEIVSHDSLQASIRIGRRTFNGGHHDYNAFYMTNMVLGGYFGARLMQNLRERNGFTYGVYSSMENMINSGYWYIHTDVGIDVKNTAIAEIYNEIDRLKETLIGTEELEMVKNYCLGIQLTSLDGVFNVSSVIKSLVITDLNAEYFYAFINTIKNISPEEIQTMAQKYLKKEDLIEVVAI